MTNKLGVQLFTSARALNRWFEGLDVALHEACNWHLRPGGDTTPDELFDVLFEQFRLHHVELGELESVTIQAHALSYLTSDGDQQQLHLAQARVPYCGSKLLLRTAPERGFRFPYQGKIGKLAVRLCTLLPGLDATEFVAEANEHLIRTREALHAARPTVSQYNDRIRDEVKRKIRTY